MVSYDDAGIVRIAEYVQQLAEEQTPLTLHVLGEPMARADQPAYLNAVLLVAADVPALAWLGRAQDVEKAAGRIRNPARRFGPRSLDVDVIAVWEDDGRPVLSDDVELTLPHPRAHLRAFVLRPWLDIAPYAELPGHGRVVDLLRREPVASDLASLVRQPTLDLDARP